MPNGPDGLGTVHSPMAADYSPKVGKIAEKDMAPTMEIVEEPVSDEPQKAVQPHDG